jgi:hypothetical protein
VQQLGAVFQRIIADLAAANGEDIVTQTDAITTTQRRTAQTVDSALK